MTQPPGPPPQPHNRGVPDPEVCKAIYRTGKEMNVSPKLMLAAFETGIVESSLQNNPGGDRDSVGVFQQRETWGSYQDRMDVAKAARKFFEEAHRVEKGNPNLSAGMTAAKTQRPAEQYRSRYDEYEA